MMIKVSSIFASWVACMQPGQDGTQAPRQYAAPPEYYTTSCPEKSNSSAKKGRLCQRILERERCSAQIPVGRSDIIEQAIL
jgi:hypothetical protein